MTKKILVVDDDPEILNVLFMTLENSGFSVEKAEDGYSALEKIKIDKPDIIISDIMMPRMNGFVLCENIKNDIALKAIPIILLTSRDDDSNKFYNEFTPPDLYLRKPFDPDELLAAIKGIIG